MTTTTNRWNEVNNAYFKWMSDKICENRFHESISYDKLLTHLYDTEFIYLIPRDRNRAEEGVNLRYIFSVSEPDMLDAERYLDKPCSILEMMVALAMHCEEWMDDTAYGDRTAQWFWEMISSLGLNGMYNDRYDKRYVRSVLTRFLNREYAPNGEGGLFTIRNVKDDLRNVEIWCQLSWYLNDFT